MIAIFDFPPLEKGIFLSRPNRYLAMVQLENGGVVTIHVHDPGRLKELLFENNPVLIHYCAHDKRKTDYDLIAAQKNGQWILLHAGYHRKIAEAFFTHETLLPIKAIKNIQAEVTYGKSRLDFCFTTAQETIYIEQKGCTLEIEGTALFPDAPTVRGVKHLEELIAIKKSGMRSALFVFVFVDAEAFSPNNATDPLFYHTFFKALDSGVEISIFQFKFQNNTLYFVKNLPIKRDAFL